MNKRILAILLILTMVFAFTACGGTDSDSDDPSGGGSGWEFTRLLLGTSSLGGSYYTLGGGWANIINSAVKDVEVTVEMTGGPSSNLELMENGEMELGFVTTWISGDGWTGNPDSWAEGNEFKRQRAIFPMYASYAHFFTLEGSGIDSIYDFNGKRMSYGNPGSSGNLVGTAVVETLDLQPKSMNAVSTEVAMDSLKDNTVDCGINVTGVPGPAFLNAETTHKIKYISFTEDEMATLLTAYPFWSEGFIPANSYKNQPEDVRAIALWNTCVCDKDLDEELVYELVKATFEHLDELKAVDAQAEQFNAQDVNNCGIPLHPGAARYYEEIGITLADNVKPID